MIPRAILQSSQQRSSMYKITITNLQKQSRDNPQILYTKYFLKVAYLHLKVAVTFFKYYRKVGNITLDTAYSNETPDGSNIMIFGVRIEGKSYDILEVKLEEVEEIESNSLSFA